MRIEVLKLREDFESGFISSLSLFLGHKYGWESSMYWTPNFFTESKSGQIVFLANDLLNVIYPKAIARERLEPITREFAFNKKLIRRLLQKTYVFSAVRFPLERVFTHSTLVIENAPEEMKHWVFIPGNHSHRIIDFSKNQCVVFKKKGFNDEFFKSELQTRHNYADLSSPKLIEFNDDEGWYVEELISGLPINRLSDSILQGKIISSAQKIMIELYKETMELKTMGSFLLEISKRIDDKINCISINLTDTEINELQVFSEQIINLIKNSNYYDELTVPTALTHGDFQAANILCDDNKLWLIDWEYSDRRSLYFDYFCFQLNSRQYHGFSNRANCFLEKIEKGAVFLDLPINVERGRVEYFWLYLLEEFLLKLDEVSSKEINHKLLAINPWIKEVKLINHNGGGLYG